MHALGLVLGVMLEQGCIAISLDWMTLLRLFGYGRQWVLTCVKGLSIPWALATVLLGLVTVLTLAGICTAPLRVCHRFDWPCNALTAQQSLETPLQNTRCTMTTQSIAKTVLGRLGGELFTTLLDVAHTNWHCQDNVKLHIATSHKRV